MRVSINSKNEKRIMKALSQLDDLGFFDDKAKRFIGSLLKNSARLRVRKSKVDSSNSAWVPWSTEYAKTRKSHHSLLVDKGTLGTTLINTFDANAVYVGSPMYYAATHQFGDTRVIKGRTVTIPMREFVGVDEEDSEDLLDYLDDRVRAIWSDTLDPT